MVDLGHPTQLRRRWRRSNAGGPGRVLPNGPTAPDPLVRAPRETKPTLTSGGAAPSVLPMQISQFTSRALLLPAALAVALAVGACGTSDEAETIQKEGAELQQRGQEVQRNAQKAAEDVAAGRKSQEQASDELAAETEQLEKDAKATASKALETAKDQGGVPDEAKDAIDQAQEQLATP